MLSIVLSFWIVFFNWHSQGNFKVQEDKKHRAVYQSLTDSEKKLQFFSSRQVACRLLGSRGYLCQKVLCFISLSWQKFFFLFCYCAAKSFYLQPSKSFNHLLVSCQSLFSSLYFVAESELWVAELFGFNHYEYSSFWLHQLSRSCNSKLWSVGNWMKAMHKSKFESKNWIGDV